MREETRPGETGQTKAQRLSGANPPKPHSPASGPGNTARKGLAVWTERCPGCKLLVVAGAGGGDR